MYTGMTPVCGAASDALPLWPLRHPADQICPTNRAMGTAPKLCTFTLLNWLLLFWKSFRIYPFIAVIIYPACRLSEVTSRGVTKIPSILNTKLLSKVPVLNQEVFEKINYTEVLIIIMHIYYDSRISLTFTTKQKMLSKLPVNWNKIIKISWVTRHANIVNTVP